MDSHGNRDRTGEWFVPAFGPPRFRVFVGLLFLPYTGMVLGYVAIGSMLGPVVHWDRVAAILAIYFLALGVGAHALDALGGKAGKPWGNAFSRLQLWGLAVLAVAAAYGIGTPYMLREVPLLWPIALAEGFFLVAYNMESFGGRFHSDFWFALSWGALPALAGFVMQTNSVSPAALLVAAAMGLLSLVEIRASRPYKALKRAGAEAEAAVLEGILKAVSGGVILLAVGLAAWRWAP